MIRNSALPCRLLAFSERDTSAIVSAYASVPGKRVTLSGSYPLALHKDQPGRWVLHSFNFEQEVRARET